MYRFPKFRNLPDDVKKVAQVMDISVENWPNVKYFYSLLVFNV